MPVVLLLILQGLRLEARVGIEPTHKGFADLSLTAWVPRHLEHCTARLDGTPAWHLRLSDYPGSLNMQKPGFSPCRLRHNNFSLESYRNPVISGGSEGSHLERETGLEPATLALARRCSTTELLPHTSSGSISGGSPPGQRNRPYSLPAR